MQPFRHIALLIAGILCTGCLALEKGSPIRMPLAEEGEMVLFLQPMPQEATSLKFIIEQAFVLHSDGRRTPIPLNFTNIDGSTLKKTQKQLATMTLEPGLYSGIAIRIKQATRATEKGDMDLLVPEAPIVAEQAFEIRPGKICALFLSFGLPETNRLGVRFTPLFTLKPAARGIITLTGYICDSQTNSLTVFDKKSMQVVDMIATGREPKDIVIDAVRKRAYVAVSGDNRVEVVDLLKRDVVENLRLSLDDQPLALALTPDGRTLVTVNNGSNSISIIDAPALVETARIRVGESPTAVVISPSGLKAFILNTRSSNLSVIDLAQKTLAVTIGLEGEPTRAAVNRDGSRLFVVSHNSPNLSIIDLTSLTVTHKVFIGAGAGSITVDTQTGLIYAGLAGPAEIVVIDPFALTPIDSFFLEGQPGFMVIESQERNLFVILPEQRQLLKIDLISKRTSAGIAVDPGANTVAFVEER